MNLDNKELLDCYISQNIRDIENWCCNSLVSLHKPISLSAVLLSELYFNLYTNIDKVTNTHLKNQSLKYYILSFFALQIKHKNTPFSKKAFIKELEVDVKKKYMDEDYEFNIIDESTNIEQCIINEELILERDYYISKHIGIIKQAILIDNILTPKEKVLFKLNLIDRIGYKRIANERGIKESVIYAEIKEIQNKLINYINEYNNRNNI